MPTKDSYSAVAVQGFLLILLATYCAFNYSLLYVSENISKRVLEANSIVLENQKKGTNIWWSDQTDEEPLIEGFTSDFSYAAHETIVFKIFVKPSAFNGSEDLIVQLWIFRLGYYDGFGATLSGNISYTTTARDIQPNCMFEVSSHMTDCDNWKESLYWNVPEESHSGVYVAVPVIYRQDKSDGKVESRGSFIPFVVKKKVTSNSITGKVDAKYGSDILFKTSDFTWVVYNKYGGWNLYRGNGSYTFDSRAVKASYNRPFQNRQFKPQGQFENFLFGADYPLLFWLEKHGYDVSYASCNDVEKMGENGDLNPSNYKILLSVGHDEYYSQSLRDAYKNARNVGVNLAFFSSNEIFWRTKWEDVKIISKDVKFIRTAGMGNLSLSFYTTENHGNEERKLSSIKSTDVLNMKSPSHLQKKNQSISHQIKLEEKQKIQTEEKTMQKNEITAKNSVIVIRKNRVIYCAKETINGKVMPSTNPQRDWTGTFTDPRFRNAEPEISLTGQKFAVNGFRSDAIEIGETDSKLRFWRDTDLSLGAVKFPYKTAKGYLGYEWDVHSDDCNKPKGLFTMSSTTKKIKHGLSESFGASYKGTDVVTHKISLYRHICEIQDKNGNNGNLNMLLKNEMISQNINSNSYNDNFRNITDKKRNLNQMRKLKRKNKFIGDYKNIKSSLVFGSGTLQWSWALSTYHDGPYVPENKYLQQATINLFADMGVQPSTVLCTANKNQARINNHLLNSNSDFLLTSKNEILKFATQSTDFKPPFSIIDNPSNNSIFKVDSQNYENNNFEMVSEFGVNNDTENQRVNVRLKNGLKRQGIRNLKNVNAENTISGGEGNFRKNVSNEANIRKIDRKDLKENIQSDFYILFSGHARDRDGGNVGGVEISFDGGLSWRQTVGREKWEFKYMVRSPMSIGDSVIRIRNVFLLCYYLNKSAALKIHSSLFPLSVHFIGFRGFQLPFFLRCCNTYSFLCSSTHINHGSEFLCRCLLFRKIVLLNIYLFIHLFIYLFIYLFTHLFIYLFISDYS